MAAQSRDGGSFLTGFGVGILAGAVGFFLKHSDQADEFHEKFRGEWKTAERFVREELKETSPLTIQGAFDQVISYLSGEEDTSAPQDTKSTSSRSATAKKKSKKFTGV